MPPKTRFDFGAETGADTIVSIAAVKARLALLETRLNEQRSTAEPDPVMIARLDKDAAWLLLELGQHNQAWQRARAQFDPLFTARDWPSVIDLCDLLFQCDHTDSLAALGQGVWLAVTFPVNPKITIDMLQHVIDETADDADGAAVAAATAVYVHDLRKEQVKDAGLYVDAMQMLTTVGRRHADAHDQATFDRWIERMELDDPEKFLVRLRNVIDALIQDQWWFDRDQMQAGLPDDG